MMNRALIQDALESTTNAYLEALTAVKSIIEPKNVSDESDIVIERVKNLGKIF